ncbi:GNAT family N-acetyltransferase [Bradyrhizobium sp. LjRoot220]|uniref:GNAT family N-acetyltransferase n=1 Tax=Bradyrhizobium sp. LjRoot220 TaxID=3342284 RepID=UPI003ED03E19
MKITTLNIERLTDESNFAASIAKLQFELWGPLTGFDSLPDYEQFLRKTVHTAELPTVLVARHGDALVGSVNLLTSEMTIRPELSPWLAPLFVVDSERGSGAGSALIHAVIDHAAKLGFRRIYLYTSGTLPSYYASRAWRPIEEVGYLGKTRTIMAFDLP